jgi:predicted Zn-dependent protease
LKRVAVAALTLMGLGCLGDRAAPGDCAGEAGRSARLAGKIREEWPLRPGDEVTLMVRGVVDRLAAAEGRRSWDLEVVRNRNAEAYSIGGGRVYISDGTVRSCESESELAAILAHEMSHQLLGHFCTPGASSDERWWQDGARRGRETAVGSVSLQVDPDRELAADRFALGMLERAGYDPTASLRIAARVQREMPRGHLDELGRVQRLQQLIPQAPLAEPYQSAEFGRVRRALLAEPGLNPR